MFYNIDNTKPRSAITFVFQKELNRISKIFENLLSRKKKKN